MSPSAVPAGYKKLEIYYILPKHATLTLVQYIRVELSYLTHPAQLKNYILQWSSIEI